MSPTTSFVNADVDIGQRPALGPFSPFRRADSPRPELGRARDSEVRAIVEIVLLATADTFWIAFGSVATACLAFMTTLALLQGRNERRQIVKDRELTWRPQLSGQFLDCIVEGKTAPAGPAVEPRLFNAGGGPAVAARVLWGGGPQCYLSEPVDVPANESRVVGSSGRLMNLHQADMLVNSVREGVTKSGQTALKATHGRFFGTYVVNDNLQGAIFCLDFLERRWCFPIAEGGGALAPLEWRGSPKRAPYWAMVGILWRQ